MGYRNLRPRTEDTPLGARPLLERLGYWDGHTDPGSQELGHTCGQWQDHISTPVQKKHGSVQGGGEEKGLAYRRQKVNHRKGGLRRRAVL